MFVDQCDKCQKMFVRDSPAPTVGQKYTGTVGTEYRDRGRILSAFSWYRVADS
jgi:hypothetical protein